MVTAGSARALCVNVRADSVADPSKRRDGRHESICRQHAARPRGRWVLRPRWCRGEGWRGHRSHGVRRGCSHVIRVLVVDDYAVVRAGLEQLLATAGDVTVAGAAADGAEALRLVSAIELDVVLMDLAMPVLDGVEATRRIVAAHPDVKVVVLTAFAQPREVLGVLRAGASGYILKDAKPDEILFAVRSAHQGGMPLDPQVAGIVHDALPVRATTDLSGRERRGATDSPRAGGQQAVSPTGWASPSVRSRRPP